MLRNDEYTDRELLNVIMRCAAEDGTAATSEIAEALGVGDNGHSAVQRIAPRLSWMKRYGFIENVDPPDQGYDGRTWKGKLWALTDIGEQMARGRLSKAAEGALGRMDPGAQLLAMRSLTRLAATDERVANAVRREYLHNTARR